MPGMYNRRAGLAECDDCSWRRPTVGGEFAEAAATRGHAMIAHPQWRPEIIEARADDLRVYAIRPGEPAPPTREPASSQEGR